MIREETVRKLLEEMDGGRGVINAEVMANTPGRVARMYNNELLSGYDTDPTTFFKSIFESEFTEMVVVTDIRFSSLCEHHLVPIIGTAHVGYIPQNGRLLGLSKISRIVDCYAKRLQLQERIVDEVANAFMKHLDPLGMGIVIEAEHGCMSMRGVMKPEARTITSVMRGTFLTNHKTQEEFLSLIRLHQNRG